MDKLETWQEVVKSWCSFGNSMVSNFSVPTSELLKLVGAIRSEAVADEKKRILVVVDQKIANCDKAIKAGSSNDLGRASGSIQLDGCKKALLEIQSLLLTK